MTFDPAQPIATQSPGLFPTANHANMSRISYQMGIDHQYNNTTAANDGWHKVIHWSQQPAIDPLTPGTAAPTTGASEVVSWEAPDTYGVARPWFRSPSNGNVSSMMGWNEIRVNNFLVTKNLQTLTTVPDNTYGEIYYYIPGIAAPLGGRGVFVKSAGICDCTSYATNNAQTSSGITTGYLSFPSSFPLSSANIRVYLYNSSSANASYNFLILYRYL